MRIDGTLALLCVSCVIWMLRDRLYRDHTVQICPSVCDRRSARAGSCHGQPCISRIRSGTMAFLASMEPPSAQSNDPPWSSEWLEESTEEGEKHATILLAIGLEILRTPRPEQSSCIYKGVPFLTMSCFTGCIKIDLGFPIMGSNLTHYFSPGQDIGCHNWDVNCSQRC